MLTVSGPVYLYFTPSFCSGKTDVAGLFNKEIDLKSSDGSSVEVTRLRENKEPVQTLFLPIVSPCKNSRKLYPDRLSLDFRQLNVGHCGT